MLKHDPRQYDLEESIRLAKERMATAIFKAPHEWREGYKTLAEAFLAQLTPKATFIGEDLRKYVEQEIGQPHHPNAWGAMAQGTLRRWRKEGRIAMIGVSQATSKKSHASLYPRYEVLDGPVS